VNEYSLTDNLDVTVIVVRNLIAPARRSVSDGLEAALRQCSA